MKTNIYLHSDWVGNTQATFVIMVTFVTVVTWGMPNHPDNSDISGAIQKGKILENMP
jgi:hypothetical protein